MSPTLMRLVLGLYVRLLLALLGALLVIFLVGDFADRLGAYLDHPVAEVAWLYWNKLLVAVQQLAPAAMLLAGGATVSFLRRRGEWTAMRALGLSRWVMVAPIVAAGAVAALLLVGFDEWVVARAGPRVDTLMANQFHRWGDFRFYYVPQQWFRLPNHLVHVAGAVEDHVLRQVTVLELDPDFRLLRRLDGAELIHEAGDRWRLTKVWERRFPSAGEAPTSFSEVLPLRLPGSSADTFLVRSGRPEFMPSAELLQQRAVRARVGLPVERLTLALHNRFAYPLTGLAATLLATTLALRPGRRGHLTLALVEGLGVTLVLFALLLAGKALVLSERMTPALSAWGPVLGLVAVSALLWWASERPRRVA
jgi:lipopolysaccharide export system permease protein